jgi:energy-coupling factor transporter ATP-binding protein EcfA2
MVLIAVFSGLVVAAGAALLPRALWLADQRRRPEVSLVHAQARDRDVLLHRVRDRWISGVLEPSLANAERLGIDLARRPDAVAAEQLRPVPHPSYAARYAGAPGTIPMDRPVLPGGTSILRLFLRAGGGLLIMGAPGSGKTTLLLQLADALLQRAGADPTQPVPIVASLESWGRHQTLTGWLAGEVAETYRIPRQMAARWLAAEDVVLLVDGFDDVPERNRGSLTEALNSFLRAHPLARVAVCARPESVADTSTSPRLMLPEAVELLPLTDAQIDTYLSRLETTWTPLAGIRAALAANETLRTPLMVRLAAFGWRDKVPAMPYGRPSPVAWPPELADPEPAIPRPGGEEFLSAFTQRALAPRMAADASPPAQRSLGYLIWLARVLQAAGHDEFEPDRLAPPPAGKTLPGWLRAPIRAVTALPAEYSWPAGARPSLMSVPMVVLVLAMPFGTALAGWFLGAAVVPVAGLGCGLAWGLDLPRRLGLAPRPRRRRLRPDEDVRRALMHACLAGAVAAAGYGLGLYLAFGVLSRAHGSGLTYLAALAAAAGAALTAGGGAWLWQQWARARIARGGVLPWRLGAFLDEMTRRGLLRRRGTGYAFSHRLLRDHLAGQ